jgi:cytochrome c553
MKINFLGFLAVFVMSYAGSAYSAGDPVAGASKNASCQGCHGIPGYHYVYPVYHEPKLGGQHAEYIVSALKEYRSHARSNPTMQAIAATLSDQDMEDLAAYYAGQADQSAKK